MQSGYIYDDTVDATAVFLWWKDSLFYFKLPFADVSFHASVHGRLEEHAWQQVLVLQVMVLHKYGSYKRNVTPQKIADLLRVRQNYSQ